MSTESQARVQASEQLDLGRGSTWGALPRSQSYRLEPVGTTSQRLTFVVIQVVVLAALLCLSVQVIQIFLLQLVGSTTIFVVLALYCSFAVFWQVVYVCRILRMKRAVLVDSRVPAGLRIAMATTIVPSREFALLRAKLEGMIRVDRCGNTIDCWVLDEEDDPRVRAMIRELNRRYRRRGARVFHFTRKGQPRYNEIPEGRRFKRFQQRQKGGNINAWLDSISFDAYEVITFLDLDHVPKPEFYRHVLPYFRDPEVAFVQGPESFRNRDENFVTRAASFERDTFFGLVHRSYFGLGMPVIVGSHTTFRRETLQALGGAYPVHLTEDYLMMLKLRSLQQRGIFVDQILAVGELPSSWSAYLGQQQRWASGGLDLLFRYFPKLFRTYNLKEKLYYFALLNYYAWGTLYTFMKGILHVFLLLGLTLHLETGLIAGIFLFTAVAAVANYLWERQFFVEQGRKSFFVENALMNNFLGCHYFIALLKAVFRPNTPFKVTAKSGAKRGARSWLAAPIVFAALIVLVDVVGLLAATVLAGREMSSMNLRTNVLFYPLVLSCAANLIVLVFFQRMEREGTATARPPLRVFGSRASARVGRPRHRIDYDPPQQRERGSLMRKTPYLSIVLCGIAILAVATRVSALNIPVAAGEVVVSVNGACSLREAIANAEAGGDTSGGDCDPGSGGADVLMLASNSTYTLPDSVGMSSGLPEITSAITIQGNGSTIERSAALFPTTPCSGGSSFRIFFVHVGASLTLEGLTLRNGCASTGGAIFNCGTVNLTDVTVVNNEANQAGGIQNDGTLNLLRSTISGNIARFAAGGGLTNTNQLGVTQSTIDNNRTAGAGGALYNVGTASFGNSTISGNTSNGNGGGIQNNGGTTANNSTISANTTLVDDGQGAGIFRASGTATFFHTIVAAQTQGTDCAGTITDAGFNLDSDGTCATATTSATPGLGALGNNGGTTETHALLLDSPAIDAGDTTCGVSVDQRDISRPQFGATSLNCDIGAFEFENDVGNTCTNDSDCGQDNCVDGVCCELTCTSTCQSCASALTGQPDGTCAPVLQNEQTSNGCNAPENACNGSGSCIDALGQDCLTPSECASGFCVDGVCCDTACQGAELICNLPGNVGMCVEEPEGVPVTSAWGVALIVILLGLTGLRTLRARGD